MNYISRYGLEFNPFVKDRKEFTVETSQYREVLARMNYLLQLKGFGLLTGGPGMGKTTALRNWKMSLNQSSNKVIYISLSTLTVTEFYRNLAYELGCEPAYRKADNFKMIQDAVDRLYIEKRILPIIILDEANYLNTGTLNDLKMLFNFDMDSRNKAVILLSGLPVLNRTLSQNAHEPLRQRICMNYQMNALPKEESSTYLLEKLKLAGSHQEVFSRAAIESVTSGAGGIPRMIDKIANACLMIANSKNENIITGETVMSAVNDISLV